MRCAIFTLLPPEAQTGGLGEFYFAVRFCVIMRREWNKRKRI